MSGRPRTRQPRGARGQTVAAAGGEVATETPSYFKKTPDVMQAEAPAETTQAPAPARPRGRPFVSNAPRKVAPANGTAASSGTASSSTNGANGTAAAAHANGTASPRPAPNPSPPPGHANGDANGAPPLEVEEVIPPPDASAAKEWASRSHEQEEAQWASRRSKGIPQGVRTLCERWAYNIRVAKIPAEAQEIILQRTSPAQPTYQIIIPGEAVVETPYGRDPMFALEQKVKELRRQPEIPEEFDGRIYGVHKDGSQEPLGSGKISLAPELGQKDAARWGENPWKAGGGAGTSPWGSGGGMPPWLAGMPPWMQAMMMMGMMPPGANGQNGNGAPGWGMPWWWGGPNGQAQQHVGALGLDKQSESLLKMILDNRQLGADGQRDLTKMLLEKVINEKTEKPKALGALEQIELLDGVIGLAERLNGGGGGKEGGVRVVKDGLPSGTFIVEENGKMSSTATAAVGAQAALDRILHFVATRWGGPAGGGGMTTSTAMTPTGGGGGGAAGGAPRNQAPAKVAPKQGGTGGSST